MPDDLEQFVVKQPHADTSSPGVTELISRETQIAFLAHILTGVPFMQRYDVANIGFVEFATVSATELDQLRRLAASEPSNVPGSDRLRSLLAVASVNRLEIDNRVFSPVHDRKWASSYAYDVFVESVPFGLLQLIESYYADFSRTLSSLIRKASDRSFWPTP